MKRTEYNLMVAEYSDGLYRFALKSIGEVADAEDVVQASFEALWKNRKKIPPEKGKSFLFTVAYRRCMDYHRVKKRTHYPETIPEKSYHPEYEWKELLQKTLQHLDFQSRQLILLKDLEGYKYEEIAEICALSTDQVRVYLHRARKKIKDFITTEQLQQ